MVHYWMGRPLSEIPREELEREFVKAYKQIQDMQGQYLKAKTDHINDLASMARRRHES